MIIQECPPPAGEVSGAFTLREGQGAPNCLSSVCNHAAGSR